MIKKEENLYLKDGITTTYGDGNTSDLSGVDDKIYYRTDFELKGSSNYAFPLVLKKANFKNRDLLEKIMKKIIEFVCFLLLELLHLAVNGK